jgi:putative colanic acid biosynthesis acetyltransferase WcaF
MIEVKEDVGPDSSLDALADSSAASWVNLAEFDNRWYAPGRGRLVRSLWYFISLLLLESGWFPFSGPKRSILRMFGAKIGRGLVIKPRVWIKFPWRLVVGDHCWIGQGAWIDNLADVRLGNHVCVSQQVYICTGSHNHRSSTFNLIVKPVKIDSGAWLAARTLVLGGVTIGANAIIAAGSVVTGDVSPAVIVGGQPARMMSVRPPMQGVTLTEE